MRCLALGTRAKNRRRCRSYDGADAATLLADFWQAVDAVLRERGVIP